MRAHPEACASFRPGGYLSASLEPLCGRCGLRATDHRRRPVRRKSRSRRRRIFPSPYAPRRKPGAVHALLAPPAVLFAGWGALQFLAELVRLAP